MKERAWSYYCWFAGEDTRIYRFGTDPELLIRFRLLLAVARELNRAEARS